MLRKSALIIAIGLLLSAASAQAYLESFTTGRDWTDRMSRGEKYISLIPPSLIFRKYNIPVEKNLLDYIRILDQVMLSNPQLADEDVANIFASTVYIVEPQTREAFRRMEMDFLRGHYDGEAVLIPDFTMSGSSSEIPDLT